MKKIYFFILLLTSLTNVSQNDITFNVDMSDYKGSFTTMYVSGSFNNWSGNENPMIDMGQGIWTITISLPNGDYKYKFTFDDYSGQENLREGDVCVIKDGGFTTRFLVVDSEDKLLGKHFFESCYERGQIPQGPHNTTFIVDMNHYTHNFTTVFISGNFNAWSGVANPMEDIGNGFWSVTLSLTESTKEFKFSLDDWTDQETFNPGNNRTVTNGGFTNRYISIFGEQTKNYIWNTEEDIPLPEEEIVQEYDITFTVNMNIYGGNYTNMYVSGNFNGWSGTENLMEDMGDGTWATTISLANGEYKYKFTYDDWVGQENLISEEVCVITDGGFTTRGFTVAGENKNLRVSLFDSCYGNGEVAGGPHTTTFLVDMNSYTNNFNTVYISGSFNDWSGTGNPLEDIGNGIWSATLSLQESTKEFKFSTDDWTDQEYFSPGDIGTVTNGGFTNRYISISEEQTRSYIWQTAGSTLSTNKVEENINFNVYPNPANHYWNITTKNSLINSIQVYDISGKQVIQLMPNSTKSIIESSFLKKGIYFAVIQTENEKNNIRLIKE